jgi:UDP-glucose 4-epimerase
LRVAVTGGAGFIGTNLVRHLLGQGWVARVVVLDDLSSGSARNLAGCAAELVEGTVLDAGDLDRALAGADAVVHLAARPGVPRSIEEPLASHHANATGTLMVLEAMRRNGVPHLVMASSSSVYGANPTLPKSEGLAPQPMSPYAVSKLAAEHYTLAYGRLFGLAVLPFRFFNVYGPHQAAGHAYAAVVPSFIAAALGGRPLTIHGDGAQTRDFTYVGTVCEVLGAAVREGRATDGPVNLAFGGRYSLLDVVGCLASQLDRELATVHTAARPGDVPHSQADQTRLRALFPDVVPVGLDEGLERTVAWFLEAAADARPGPG